ncbi:MAG: HEPN domain-containing protein [Nitrospirae bacterium]|nr:HEPN domain-containing protein [Nitrospirota bacterium]
MNEQKDSLSSRDWLKIARKDWVRVRHMLEKEDAEAAGFFFQQSLEKYLKAFLLQLNNRKLTSPPILELLHQGHL